MNWASALRPCGHAELDIWSEASADNCPQERSCSRYCRNSKHNWLLRSWFQRSIFLTPFKERKRKKKKRTQKATGQDAQHPELLQEQWSKWQQEIKSCLTEWPSCLQAAWRREPGDDGTRPSCSLWMHIGNSPLKGQSQGQPQTRAKNFKSAKPRILIPTPQPVLQKTAIENDTRTHRSLQWFLQLPRHKPKNRPTDRWILKSCCTYVQWAMTQTWNPTSEIMKLGQQSQQGWALEENTLKRS